MSFKEGACQATLSLELEGYKNNIEAAADGHRATAILMAPGNVNFTHDESGWKMNGVFKCAASCFHTNGKSSKISGACMAERIKKLLLQPQPKLQGKCLKNK